ncbi:hypothetical protein J2S94_003601 [Arthrobacter bambusae]|nr:hypothetical protein [Arthrobacter bambusae]
MKNSSDNEWALRVGSPAVASLRKANRFLSGCSAALALEVGGILALKLGPQALPFVWTCVFAGLTYVFVIYPIGYYYWEGRGAREAAEHINLSDYSPRKRVAKPALRSTRDFDNFMLEEGIPPRPGYTPDPAPRAYALAEKMRQKRERALQKRQTR